MAVPRIAIEVALDSFTQSLGDPHQPATCATHLVGCVAVIYNLRTGIPTPNTRAVSRHHGFFNLAVSFLTAPRTSTEFSRLMSHLGQCACPVSHPGNEQLHNIGLYWAEYYKCTPTVVLMFFLFSFPANIFREANKTRVAKGENKSWPKSISDVIPFGFDALVEATSRWLIVLPNPTALMFLAGALEVCGRPLFTAITTSPTFLERFIPSFRNTCTRLRRSGRRDKLPASYLFVIAAFLFRVMVERTSQNSIMIWTKGRELELYAILSDAITIARDPGLSSLESEKGRTTMDITVNLFHAFAFHFSKDVERPPDLHPDLAPAPEPSGEQEPLLRLNTNLTQRTQACYASGCRRSFQDVGHAYQKCGGCRHVAYCSKGCQIADWKAPEFPHKIVCKQLQIFFGAGGLGKVDDEEAFLRNFDHASGDEVISPLNAWCKARDAQREMQDLQAHFATSGINDVRMDEPDDTQGARREETLE
ncbi:hypothetical protein DFH09DRAFT_1467571 [Mycena vulgaris]|nr:hypothetical protein DFH09DRAFT_1467571 [Mycena vulgaris]